MFYCNQYPLMGEVLLDTLLQIVEMHISKIIPSSSNIGYLLLPKTHLKPLDMNNLLHTWGEASVPMYEIPFSKNILPPLPSEISPLIDCLLERCK